MKLHRLVFIIGLSVLVFCCLVGEEAVRQETGADCAWSEKRPVFPWLEGRPAGPSLCERIAPPKGYKRLAQPAQSFGTWLRQLPLLPPNSPVKLFNGQVKAYQAGAAAVFDLDIGKQDLQQCADAAMRLKAEYLYGQKKYADIAFNYTSGHRVAFEDWAKGKKPQVQGNKVFFSPASTNQGDYSYPNFKRYLNNIFNFAGTASLEKELKPRKNLKEIQIGDLFIKGGFPGHAVLVLDLAENEAGERVFLLGQSYMPAQSFHILHNFYHNPSLGPWYPLDFGLELRTPEWTFKAEHLRAFF